VLCGLRLSLLLANLTLLNPISPRIISTVLIAPCRISACPILFPERVRMEFRVSVETTFLCLDLAAGRRSTTRMLRDGSEYIC
jgi:hypothetical protein